MDKLKKLWKELSIFGIVLVVFIVLFAYQNIFYGDYIAISESKVVDMMEDKDDFVVVVGNPTENDSFGYLDIMDTFVNKNRDEKLYYVDVSENETTETTAFLKDTMKSDDITLPQTFLVKDGEVVTQQTGALSYYRLIELFEDK